MLGRRLESFCEFLGEGALAGGRMICAARVGSFADGWIRRDCCSTGCCSTGCGCRLPVVGHHWHRTLGALRRGGAFDWKFAAGFRGLGRVGAKKTILQRGSIKPPDYGIHLFLIWRFDKSEALRLLGLWVADNLYRVCDQVFGRQPRFDIVGCHPNREISEENGKAHEIVVYAP